MDREALEALDIESLIRQVLGPAKMTASLTRQVEALTAANATLAAWVVELEAKLAFPTEGAAFETLGAQRAVRTAAHRQSSFA